MIDDKYVGLALAITSSLAIGSSFVITKKGLNQASERHGFEGEGFKYLKNPTWWGGMVTMGVGEVANFAAYAFAPAILVTPLGALSVLIGAVLGTHFLNERLGRLGKVGCAMCLVGTVVIVLHAPPDKDIESINTMLDYALRPGFLIYCAIVGIFASAMIYRVAPRYGRKNPLVYLSICSTVGSISIMAIKAFGIALKLTLRGDNQFTHASTYVFLIVVAVCIVTQMNYFNKALSQFSTNVVNPLYYVLFTSATILASLILFGGFNTTDAVNTISLLCGFLVIFTGVYLLNMCRDTSSSNSESSGPGSRDGDTEEASKYLFDVDGVPTDGLAGLQTRRSMQLRRSMESANGGHYRSSSGSLSFARGESHRLMQDYAREEGGGAGSGRLDGSTNPSPGAAQQASAGGPFGRWSNRRRTLSRDHYDLDDLAEDPETEDEEAKALATPTNALSEDGDADRNGNGNGNGGATTKRTSFEGMGKGGGVNSTTTALS